MSRARVALFAAVVVTCTTALACGIRERVPTFRVHDARFGYLGGSGALPSAATMCRGWMANVVARDEHAITHSSFPETNVQDACFVRVRHEGDDVARPADETPRGCASPNDEMRRRAQALAGALEADADGAASAAGNALFACNLAPDERRVAARHNARVLRRLADDAVAYPYAAVVVPGHGLAAQSDTSLVRFRPGGACIVVDPKEHDALGGMMPRTRRASALLRGNVAPIAIVSGAAVHSLLNESFAMLHLMTCARSDVPSGHASVSADRVLLEPCADHTHTNLRNAARWLDAIGARNAYVITDDFIQAKYFQDQGGFELLMGSIDQRSLRDWGYVIGSWRQASIGNASGFWFTPYRFWAEPRDGLGAVTCVW